MVIVLLGKVKMIQLKNVFHAWLEHFNQNQIRRLVTHVELGNIKTTRVSDDPTSTVLQQQKEF